MQTMCKCAENEERCFYRLVYVCPEGHAVMFAASQRNRDTGERSSTTLCTLPFVCRPLGFYLVTPDSCTIRGKASGNGSTGAAIHFNFRCSTSSRSDILPQMLPAMRGNWQRHLSSVLIKLSDMVFPVDAMGIFLRDEKIKRKHHCAPTSYLPKTLNS